MSEDTCVRCNGTGKNSGGRRCGRCGGDGREVSPVEGSQEPHREFECPVDGCRVCMPLVGVVVSVEYAEELDRLRAENERLREALREIADWNPARSRSPEIGMRRVAHSALGGSQAKGSE